MPNSANFSLCFRGSVVCIYYIQRIHSDAGLEVFYRLISTIYISYVRVFYKKSKRQVKKNIPGGLFLVRGDKACAVNAAWHNLDPTS